MILPAHEQFYPVRLLKTRLEEYILDDKPPTLNRAFAKKVSGLQVLEAITAAQFKTGLYNIDPRYFVGTCFHESGCTNEWDTEIATSSNLSGFVSVGAYQIGSEEAKRYGFVLADMLDLNKASECMVKLAEANRQAIRAAIALPHKSPDPDYTDSKGEIWKGGNMRAYLAITHNHGVGYMRQTIRNYGLNWNAFKQRNPSDNIVAHGYGEDCITGGPFWVTKAPFVTNYRDLFLIKPFMTGEDVKELQRHLKIAPDGVFGPGTEQAVKLFQRSHGLAADGVCRGSTWELLLDTK